MSWNFLSNLTLLAQEADPMKEVPWFVKHGNLFLFGSIGLLFYFLLIRPQRLEQRRRKEMLSAVKKNDRVITTGGIYGVVTNVDAEADEVTIKVDEATNTKLRLSLGSITRVHSGESSGENSKKA